MLEFKKVTVLEPQDSLEQQIKELNAQLVRLESRHMALARQLNEISLEVAAGDLSHSWQAPTLREQEGQVEATRKHALRLLAEKKLELARRELAAKRLRWNTVISEIERERELVIEDVRSAAMGLGRLYTLRKELSVLINGLANMRVGSGDETGCWPADVAALRAASVLPDVYQDWEVQYVPVDLDSGCIRVKPVTKFGEGEN